MAVKLENLSRSNSLPKWDNLSLEEQVAQMVVVRASGYLFDHQIQYPDWEPPAKQLQHWLQDLGVGGVIFVGGSAGEVAIRSQQLQNWAKVPLLIAADIEEGTGQRFSGATWFPPPMAIGAVAAEDEQQAQLYAAQMGAITAQEALAIGINWILAPVVDVNNNPQNPVINVRSFGETPAVVSQLATSFIQGAQQYPVLTTAKHFPGHGDTATDSHLKLPTLPHAISRLETVELPPFQDAIASGVDAVMTAHLLIPAWDKQYPATLSKQVLTQVLRSNLGFEGLIVTDALVMGAITNRYGAQEAPVMAVEAGADIVLMPSSPEGAIQAICEAVRTGRISQEQIQASVERIWQAKTKVFGGLESQSSILKNRVSSLTTPTPNLLLQLAQPSALTTVANILQDSQKIGGSVPLPPEPPNSDRQPCNLIVVDNAITCDFLGRNAPAVVLPRQLGYELQLIDGHTPAIAQDLCNSGLEQPTLLQLFIRCNPFRESIGLTPLAKNFLNKLLKKNNLQALVIYGSPYILEQLQPDLPPATPYVFSYGQTPEAQAIALKVLFAEATPVHTFTEFL
ncbi:MAG: beta-glucosidase [Symploca sp. SIO2E6]|nr:beta-glucosidase [Symploca sp. SIO2E6]